MSSNPFTNVTPQWLSLQLRLHQSQHDFSELDSDGNVADMEVRVQVSESRDDATTHTGSAQYDTDHSGYWGYGYVAQSDAWSELLVMAESMIAEAAEAAELDDAS